MQIEKTENLNSSTNISNNNFPIERTQLKYQSTKEMIAIPLSLRGNKKSKSVSSQSLVYNKRLRRDIYGSLILKGGRKHKVSFLDWASPILDVVENEDPTEREMEIKQKPIAEIVNVESLKEDTAKMVFNEYSKNPSEDTVCCESSACVII